MDAPSFRLDSRQPTQSRTLVYRRHRQRHYSDQAPALPFCIADPRLPRSYFPFFVMSAAVEPATEPTLVDPKGRDGESSPRKADVGPQPDSRKRKRRIADDDDDNSGDDDSVGRAENPINVAQTTGRVTHDGDVQGKPIDSTTPAPAGDDDMVAALRRQLQEMAKAKADAEARLAAEKKARLAAETRRGGRGRGADAAEDARVIEPRCPTSHGR